MAVYAFIVIYPIGIPMVMALLLYLNQNMLGDHAGGVDNVAKWWFGA